MLLDRANKVLGIVDVSTGRVAGTVADPKVIFSAALKANTPEGGYYYYEEKWRKILISHPFWKGTYIGSILGKFGYDDHICVTELI